jgi:hypothetical protein
MCNYPEIYPEDTSLKIQKYTYNWAWWLKPIIPVPLEIGEIIAEASLGKQSVRCH